MLEQVGRERVLHAAHSLFHDCVPATKLGITNVSQFAYLADGKNGLHVVQLTSAETPGNDGFSPTPNPQLVATKKLPKGGRALWISRGLDMTASGFSVWAAYSWEAWTSSIAR